MQGRAVPRARSNAPRNPRSTTFVAVAFGNAVSAAYPNGVSYSAVSTDGINWTIGALPGPASWNNVAYGGGLFVAIAGTWGPTFNGIGGTGPGNFNAAATSVDGLHWISNPTPSASNWAGLAYGNDSFIAVAGQGGNNPAAILTITQSTPPTIAIASPTAGQAIAGPATVTLAANVAGTASGAAIRQVQYFSGSTLIGSATQAPYNVIWNNLPEGSYSVTALAIDSHGSVSTSAPVAFQVSLPIQVAITSPANGAQLSGKNLTLSASVSGTAITQLAFYNGSALLGTMSQPPYSITFPDLDAGSYSITAQATDSLGLVATSSAVNITVLPDGQTSGGVGSGGQAVYDVHTDQLNTPRMVTDQTGNIVWQLDNTDPFGGNLPNQDPNNTGNQFVFNLRFAGQYYDVETGTHYNYYRDYDPTTGRYIQSDPIGLHGGINTYAYGGSNAVANIDRYGLKCNASGCWETPDETAARDRGDVAAYYSLACQGGDAYACNAGRVAADDGSSSGWMEFLTEMTNVRLNDSILDNLQNPTDADILRAINAAKKIKLELMQGYGKYLHDHNACEKNPVRPSRKFLTDLHHQVFKANGADPADFGGSTVDNSWFLNIIIKDWIGYDWCPNCL